MNKMKKLKPIWFGFALSALFVTLIITAYITQSINSNIRQNITEGIVNECSEVGFVGLQLERCIQKSGEGGTIPYLKEEDCGGCGVNQLCLVGEDKLFCEKNVTENKVWINLASFLDTITKTLINLSMNIKLIIIAVLFVIGFIYKQYSKHGGVFR